MMYDPVQSKILKNIDSPEHLKSCSIFELEQLAAEIRAFLLENISKHGGHLASNLGAVELTIALHSVFNSPKDQLIWDVGHQAYVHKLLTGRKEQFHAMRQLGGISGFLKRTESEHDIFGAGHVGTAISAALGLAQGQDLLKENNQVVAIVGDGTLTNGLAYEGLNNIGEKQTNITVVLNDNDFSISKNIGGIAKYLSTLAKTDLPADNLQTIFQALGLQYFGPIDGHDITALKDIFEKTKSIKGPKLVHVVTQKGKGYKFAEENPTAFHFISPFDVETGKRMPASPKITYSKAFGEALVKIGKKDPKVIAITAAMSGGTSTSLFEEAFPERFFDVGIAEEHAVVFAAGMTLKGFKPVVAIYSSFLQRAYDQIIHDVALQKIPVVFAVDRAGIVGTDGPTHHGIFDITYLRSIPNLKVLAPKDQNELQHMLYSILRYKRGPVAIRYPKGTGTNSTINKRLKYIPIYTAEKLLSGTEGTIIAIGSTVDLAYHAGLRLKKKGINISVYNARSIKPLDKNMIQEAARSGKILTIEENILDGGFGSAVLEELEKEGLYNVAVKRIGLKDFIEHGDPEKLRQLAGLSIKNIQNEFIKLIKNK